MIKRKDIKPLQGTLVAQSVEAGRASVTYTGKWSVSARGRKGTFINTRTTPDWHWLLRWLARHAPAEGSTSGRALRAPTADATGPASGFRRAAATPSPGLRPAGRSLFGPHLHDDSSGMQSCI